jgi:acetoacetyl-CoA synthetase
MSVLWEPSKQLIADCRLSSFAQKAAQRAGRSLADYHALYDWSVEQTADFWDLVWDELGVIASHKGEQVLENGDLMPGARWFPEARLNYAENLLRRPDEREAIVFRGEDQVERRLSRKALYDEVSRLAAAFKEMGVGQGDRVAAYMPNMPETIVAMLATASLGAIWSSCSPDFGVTGVVDRFAQIDAKVLIAAEGVFYNGKSFDNLPKISEIMQRLPTVEQLILVPYTRSAQELKVAEGARLWPDVLAAHPVGDIEFSQVPFDHPLFIMFSSGTTGVPKCIVHGVGGTLLQHMKEHQLHSDVRPGDRVFYFTTCGWMMWNWLVSALASEAVLLLYDGSPFYPDGNVLWQYAQAEQMTLFGTAAKYIDALKKEHYEPGRDHDLSALRTMTSTGSPLVPESFDYVYEHIKQDLCLASISGGTDIISCFALGCPILPVHRGELQCRGLGMAVEVYGDHGPAAVNEKGDLVCTRPFPSMPIGFWNDPDGSKYHKAYFERFENIWCHGDFVCLTEHKGMIFFGRSDAVLNPGGVRIGSAEIYRQVEKLDEVMESIVVGQDWQDDVRLVLFVRLRDGIELDDALRDKIRKHIRANASPRHVPAVIAAVSDIPRTKSGKIVELAVRDIIHGRAINNIEALANPEALEDYKNRAELAL